MIALSGCGGGGGAQSGRGGAPDAAGVFEAGGRGETAAWRIALGSVPGGMVDASELIAEIESVTGLRGIEVGERAGSRVLVLGRYGSPETTDAQRDLTRVRRAEASDGSRPFAAAFFLPPNLEAARGRNARYDLRNAKELHGPDVVYTLQINVYGRGDRRAPTVDDLAEFRRLAERAVEQLRAEGQPAFFYHGPTSSSVTVGLFGPEDHDPTTEPPLESQRLRAVREAYPEALLNGRGVYRFARTRSGERARQLQRSFLVAVPG